MRTQGSGLCFVAKTLMYGLTVATIPSTGLTEVEFRYLYTMFTIQKKEPCRAWENQYWEAATQVVH